MLQRLMAISFSDNPWSYLKQSISGGTKLEGVGSASLGVFASVANILITLGCTGGFLTIMASGVYLIWTRSSQVRQDAKSNIMYKLIIIFCLCSATTLLGVFKAIADGMFD